MGGSAVEEFPLLSALGLYAADIRGDGTPLLLLLLARRCADVLS
jgi:hypothetical protein